MQDVLGDAERRHSSPLRQVARRVATRMELVLLGATSILACQPGELNDAQEEYLARQLDNEYGATASGDSETQPGSPTTVPSQSSSTTTSSSNTSTSTGTSSMPQATTESASSGPDSTSAPPSPVEIPECATQIFQTACAGSACHYGSDFKFQPDFEKPDTFSVLTTGMTGCATALSKTYLDLDDPQNSYLLVKVRGEQPNGCGTVMPPPGATLTAEQLTCLEDWIGSL